MIKSVNLENKTFDVISGYWQWHKGQILKITGIDLPEGTEIHFSLQEAGGTAAVKEPVKTEDGYEVKIPQFIFEGDATEDYHAFAFVYQEKGDIGETTHKIKMHITARPRPDDYVHGEDEVLTWKQLDERIRNLEENGVPVERIEEAVEAYLAKNGIEADVYIRVFGGYIQYSTDNEVWNNVIAVSDLRGPKGNPGQPGYTPQKGIDYYTQADKTELVSDVLSALPTWQGGAY